MKKLFLPVIITIMTAIAPAWGQIPDVKVENRKGETVRTSSLLVSGVPMIISFWSTTCKPCLKELNTINDLSDEWKKKADFRVVAVSIDDSRSLSRAKVLATAWDDFIVLFDKNQELKRAMNVNMIPQVFVVDADGKVIYSHTGYTPGGEDELLKAILKAGK